MRLEKALVSRVSLRRNVRQFRLFRSASISPAPENHKLGDAECATSSAFMGGTPDLWAQWGLTAKELSEIVAENPSMRGLMFGFVAEYKLKKDWLLRTGITNLERPRSHDRKQKCDFRFDYRGINVKVEVQVPRYPEGEIQRAGFTKEHFSATQATPQRSCFRMVARSPRTVWLQVASTFWPHVTNDRQIAREPFVLKRPHHPPPKKLDFGDYICYIIFGVMQSPRLGRQKCPRAKTALLPR